MGCGDFEYLFPTHKMYAMYPYLKSCATIIGLLSFFMAFSQEAIQYTAAMTKAKSLYEVGKYAESSATYEDAFRANQGNANPSDRYDAARSYTLDKDLRMSFYHLMRLAKSESKYRNYNQITTDPDLDYLHDDDRWFKLISIVKANQEAYETQELLDAQELAENQISKRTIEPIGNQEPDIDQPSLGNQKSETIGNQMINKEDQAKLRKDMLDAVYNSDQKYRNQIGGIEKNHGRDSDEIKAHWDLINRTDSINLIKVKTILDQQGWLGPDAIGTKGNSALFLVIQHADIETQLQYLPMMRAAVKTGDAQASSLALLEDRVALRQGRRQIYGSQIARDQETGDYYVSPLDDPDSVDERRAEVGLGPLEAYLDLWDIKWDVDTHVKRTQNIESHNK